MGWYRFEKRCRQFCDEPFERMEWLSSRRPAVVPFIDTLAPVDVYSGSTASTDWQHVASVFYESGGSVYAELYVDGELVGSSSRTGSFNPDGNEEVCIGNQLEPGVGGPSSGLQFWGLVDDVRISTGRRYTTDFTPDGYLEADADTLGLWRFDHGSGTTVIDSGPDGYDGLLSVYANYTDDVPDADNAPESLICDIDTESIDGDADVLSYDFSWEVDGVAYTDATTTIETGDTVPADDISGNETWTCTVTPNDGDEDGSSASAEYFVEGCIETSGSKRSVQAPTVLQILEDGYQKETASIGSDWVWCLRGLL